MMFAGTPFIPGLGDCFASPSVQLAPGQSMGSQQPRDGGEDSPSSTHPVPTSSPTPHPKDWLGCSPLLHDRERDFGFFCHNSSTVEFATPLPSIWY